MRSRRAFAPSVTDLCDVGLALDEAFLIGMKRVFALHPASRRYATEHGAAVWVQIGTAPLNYGAQSHNWTEGVLFAVTAATLLTIAKLIDRLPINTETWFPRKAVEVVLACLAAYFVRRRGMPSRAATALVAAFAAGALVVNLYPFTWDSVSRALVLAHLPVVLWGGLHGRRVQLRGAARGVRPLRRRVMYLLPAHRARRRGTHGCYRGVSQTVGDGAGVDFDAVGPWVLSAGAAGVVLTAAVLVESQQGLVENIAPALTKIFTPCSR